MDGVLHNNNRKEKRQYKKRKHKNQREKQPSGMFEICNSNAKGSHELIIIIIIDIFCII